MGQKVNPHGLRVGVIKNWDSNWIASKSEMGDLILEDYKLREYIKKNLFGAGVSKTTIERSNQGIRVTIHCAKPGMVIGRGGDERCTFRHSVPRCVAELYLLQEVYNFLVECRSTSDYLVETASEGF